MDERLDTREQQMTMKLPELPGSPPPASTSAYARFPGPKTNGVIAGWLTKLKAWWSDDATPWCGTFAAMCVAEAGLTPPKDWYRATAWLTLPVSLPQAAYGCIVVFTRQGGGHVGFVVGVDKAGNLMVLGGNQGDAVNIKAVRRVPRRRLSLAVGLSFSRAIQSAGAG